MLRCIAGGGTGFAHETYRIPAYTEYYIYKYQNMEANKQYQVFTTDCYSISCM